MPRDSSDQRYVLMIDAKGKEELLQMCEAVVIRRTMQMCPDAAPTDLKQMQEKIHK